MAEPSLDDTGQQAFERNEANNQWLSKIGQTWPARAAMSALEAFKLPGQVYSGEVQLRGEDGNLNAPAVDKIAELASMISGGSFAMPAVKGGAGMGIRAYHGSPYDFDRFDLSKIGTGEGAQAYGHGLYFADNETVARTYRDKVSAMRGTGDLQVGGRKINWDDPLEGAAFEVMRHGGDREAAAEFAARTYKRGSPVPDIIRSGVELPEVRSPGRMYEVDINAHPDQFLDWDKPLSQQAPASAAMKRLAEFNDSFDLPYSTWHHETTDVLAPSEISEIMKGAGIPGIKYLDQGSRAAGDGTRNYVVFDDKIVNILRKYGIAAGTMTPPAFSALAEFMAQGQPQGEQ